MSGDYSEDTLIEQPAIALLAELGWETANVFQETFGSTSTLGRETAGEVVLVQRLRAALDKINPDFPAEALDSAIEELTRERGTMSPAQANREVYDLLKNGVKVKVRTEKGDDHKETVQFIDWQNPDKNDFFLASQLWVTGDMYKRRCDLIGFVNGIPLVFIELKASHRRLEAAYTDNLRDYKDTIPHLFWYNAFIVLSNGSQSRMGSSTASWEHFAEWKKISDEKEAGLVSLETMLRGACDPTRLLDLVENFTLFEEAQGGLIKKVAKNHQYLGVNRAIASVQHRGNNQGRLGVFWHTQGSGKSVSMVFFAQKVLRTLPGNWTFVIVTDRKELDEQIYKHFVSCEATTDPHAQADSGEKLQQLLKEDHRYVFTLIQKFRTQKGQLYPELSKRSDIIVITDEAHRSQYDVFAMNMRQALPNAAFIGFTGTPLMAGEEKTKEVFGDYVSIYNFKQSADDRATVPLFYENRIPELQLTNQELNEDMERLLEEAELDEAQEEKLEREFAKEYHLITRNDRLEKVAEDLVAHFMGRGHQGKAMVICIDKATAVRMYDKVQVYWQRYLNELKARVAKTSEGAKAVLEKKIAYMQETDMAVVVSQAQNEIADMHAKGLDIAPHRRRMVNEDLDIKFKDPDDPLRMVFVCAMWMTGFDVPCLSTLYLDKPMRNHTLMQTIARANRVFGDKVNGLIVDYVGVFRNLRKALAIYASPTSGGEEGESPVQDKAELVEWLRDTIEEAKNFCTEQGFRLDPIQVAEGFEKVRLLDDAVDALVGSDNVKRRFLLVAGKVVKLYKAILPDPRAGEFAPISILLKILTEKIHALAKQADIGEVMGQVEDLLDESVATEGYVIQAASASLDSTDHLVDISQIDFEALKATFAKSRKRTEAEKLRGLIERKLNDLVQLNRTRMNYLVKFQEMIDAYNGGSVNVEQFFEELVEFTKALNEEDRRGIAENLSEEELALFDILTRPNPGLSKNEEAEVKKVARGLLQTLKQEKLVLDWRKRQQARAAVLLCIEEYLDRLPSTYTTDLYQEKCDQTYQHVYDSYSGAGKSVYANRGI